MSWVRSHPKSGEWCAERVTPADSPALMQCLAILLHLVFDILNGSPPATVGSVDPLGQHNSFAFSEAQAGEHCNVKFTAQGSNVAVSSGRRGKGTSLFDCFISAKQTGSRLTCD